MKILKYCYKAFNTYKFKQFYKSYGDKDIFSFDSDIIKIDNNAPIKLALVTMVKNEADIIEHFVRINSLWASHLFVIDDGSIDGTLDTLELLKEEGFNLTILTKKTIDYQQNLLMTNIVRKIAETNLFNYIFPIDADEIIFDPEGLKSELINLELDDVCVINWSSIVPIDEFSIRETNPFHGHFEKVETEANICEKMIIPNNIAKECFIHMGNHDVSSDVYKINKVALKTRLFHAPVRSRDQILSKLIIGSYKFSLKKNKSRGEGSHWTSMADKLREHDFIMDNILLRSLSYNYAGIHKLPIENNLCSLDISIKKYPLKYTRAYDNMLVKILDSFIHDLVISKI